jgi:hypothetical protein
MSNASLQGAGVNPASPNLTIEELNGYQQTTEF